jgi:hypothetical protein
MVVMLQGFIVLFSGAMAYVLAPAVGRVIGAARRRAHPVAVPEAQGISHG